MGSKKLFLSLAILNLCSITGVSTAMADGRGFTVEDLVKMERVGSPAISPDGKQVVYAVRTTDLDKNRGRFDLWLLNLDEAHPTPKKLSNIESNNEGNNSGAVWSNKGDAIYFISTRTGSGQIWRLPIAGGTATQVTQLPVDVESFKIAPQDDKVLMSLEVFRDCVDLNCSKDRLEKNAKIKASGKIYDKLFIRHWDTWSDGRRNVLYSAPLNQAHVVDSAPVSLSGSLEADVHSKPDGDQEDYGFSPDGKSVVFSARIAGKNESWSTNFDLFQVAASGGTPKNLTSDNKAWDAKPSFSPDGQTLAYLAMKRPGFEADRFQIMLMDVKTGKKR
ncbi:MAG: S9 family peptidase, partial [Undibacterium sp.]|nr:S9 family peptidase [Undibacterium sp.]